MSANNFLPDVNVLCTPIRRKLPQKCPCNQTSNKRVSNSESWWVLSLDESSLRRAHVSQTQSISTRELLAAEPRAKESPPAHDQSRPAPRLRHCQHTISLGQHLVSDTASTRSVSASTPGIYNVPQGVARQRRSTPHKAPSTRQTSRRPSRRDCRRRGPELHPVAYRSRVMWFSNSGWPCRDNPLIVSCSIACELSDPCGCFETFLTLSRHTS